MLPVELISFFISYC